jgi:Tol biopolymer transport system component
MFDAILNRAPVPPSRLNLEVSPELERIILKLLEKERELRYQSAAELKVDLKRLRRDSHSSSVKTEAASAPSRPIPKAVLAVAAGIALAALVTALWFWLQRAPVVASQSHWTALTDFADSAVQPAISPDGRMLAFIRGLDPFLTTGDIYLKLLPNGDPVQLTHDGMSKMSLVFAPDGSKVAYTGIDEKGNWNTYAVPVLGGEPQLVLPNAEGLRWIGDNRLLFSEIKQGIHMVLVTSSESRAGSRDIYTPPSDRGMAHHSALAPDGTRVLMTEMGSSGEWLPCRLVPFDGSSVGVQVGPPRNPCTGVAWSPDGKWMYLNVDGGDGFHLWRQKSPKAMPEQITFGPTEQRGITVSADGRTLLTSAGTARFSVWLHRPPDEDREISTQGNGFAPRFSPDGARLYYLRPVNSAPLNRMGGRELQNLMAVDVASLRAENLFPDLSVLDYDISPSGKRVVFTSPAGDGTYQLWIASLDRRSSPQRVPVTGILDEPAFASEDEIYLRALEGGKHWLQRVRLDGSGRRTLFPIVEFAAISPDREWLVVGEAASGERTTMHLVAHSADGSHTVVLCDACNVRWSPDQRQLYFVFFFGSGRASSQIVAVPTASRQVFPVLPRDGVSFSEAMKLPGAKRLDKLPLQSPVPGVYAYGKQIVQRNIYQIPLR